jgi:D-3-phosphoglycerate dehydrogenase
MAAVKSAHLYGAGLDVVKNEPVKPDNPLLSDPRILVTPHIAGSTDVMLEGTVKYLSEVLAKYVRGVRPEGVVNEPKEPRTPLRQEV